MDNSIIINAVIIFLLGVGITSLCIPLVIKLAIKKRLFSEGGGRHVHKGYTPRLGGVAIFVGFLFCQAYFILDTSKSMGDIEPYYLVFFSVSLLFLLGLIDDLASIRANLKFIIQLLVAVILVWKADVRIDSFYGLFGIEELPLWCSYIFSILVITFFVNAFNLIDGLDSLSSSVGIYVLICFTFFFFCSQDYANGIIAISMIGSLLGFLAYNKPPARIFMGDSGTLSVGLLMAYFAIQLSNTPLDAEGTKNPVFAMVILVYPVIDTLRVFTKRILNRTSPFTPDRNHIHHILLDIGLSHGSATQIIVFTSAILGLIAYQLRSSHTLSFIVLVILILLVSQVPTIILKRKTKNDS